jgi:hypothetical protein
LTLPIFSGTAKMPLALTRALRVVIRAFSPQEEEDMTSMKKIIGSIVFITVIITSGVSFADNADKYHLELGASSSGLEARLDAIRPRGQGYFTAGVGAMYEDNHDEYRIVDVKFAVGSETLIPYLACEAGFKGLLGDVDIEPEGKKEDGDLAAIGFLLSAAYEIPKTVLPIPVKASATACYAPRPLSFADSEWYSELGFGLGFHIIENAAIVLGYKHIKIHFHKHDRHSSMHDDAVSLGLRLNF